MKKEEKPEKEPFKYPLLNLRGKDYLEVKWRLVWFREENPHWSIETEVHPGDAMCLAKAIIKNEQGRIIATAHKFEDKQGFGDYIEKSETGAIGRALALIGYGTQFAMELEEGERIVDAPVESPKPTEPGDVVIPFGKNKGRRVKELKIVELENDLNYWNSRLSKEGKKPDGLLAKYLLAMAVHLADMTNKPEEDVPF